VITTVSRDASEEVGASVRLQLTRAKRLKSKEAPHGTL
jgi:hypothetical protein